MMGHVRGRRTGGRLGRCVLCMGRRFFAALRMTFGGLVPVRPMTVDAPFPPAPQIGLFAGQMQHTKDGRRGRGLPGFGGFRRLMERWVGGMSQTREGGFETSSLHPGQLPLMKSTARSPMASTVRLRFARTVSGMMEASMMRSPSTPKTLQYWSTTASGSVDGPILQVLETW